MKHTPIKDPKHTGCLCCPRPERTLPKNTILDVGFGDVTLKIEYPDGTDEQHHYMSTYNSETDDYTEITDTPESVEKQFADKFDKAECVTLFFFRPLRDDLWEYNKEDSEWYLVKQGQGFA